MKVVVTHRGHEANSFNVVRIAREAITIEHHLWQPGQGSFQRTLREDFVRAGGAWNRADEAETSDEKSNLPPESI